jgi:hypothetical protein
MRSAPALVLALSLAFVPSAAEEPEFPWLTDLPTARAKAATEGLPLLVVFRCER